MFRKLIVGLDEREGGRDALALAHSLLLADGTLVAAHVVIAGRAEEQAQARCPSREQCVRAPELLEAAVAKSRVVCQTACLAASSVAEGLHQLAAHEHADAIVIGSCRRSPIGRILAGDDARATLTHAPCAIVLAPRGYAGRPARPNRIGVAYNGSAESEHALAVARALAASCNATLSACEVVPRPAYVRDPWNVAGAIDDAVREARQRIAALGDVEPHAVCGSAAEELARFGASVDLLVIGPRGYGLLLRLVHGGTTQQLAHAIPCPLLAVAPRPRRAG